MTIGELAERTGVSRRLLRYYEEQRLITPSRALTDAALVVQPRLPGTVGEARTHHGGHPHDNPHDSQSVPGVDWRRRVRDPAEEQRAGQRNTHHLAELNYRDHDSAGVRSVCGLHSAQSPAEQRAVGAGGGGTGVSPPGAAMLGDGLGLPPK